LNWVTAASIRQQLLQLWKQGELCLTLLEPDRFPLRLPLKQPSARVMLDESDAMRAWVADIRQLAARHDLALEWREVRHRTLGRNELPCALLFASPGQAAAVIGKSRELALFRSMCETTAAAMPQLCQWLAKRPLKALELATVWPQLLTMTAWMLANPQPGIYVRQIDAAGLDSKFIERHRGVLAELFDLVLPETAVNQQFTGTSGFARRYGFLDKPLLVRMRPLDEAIRWLCSAGDQDVSLTAASFTAMVPPVRRVFITENEINYLAFPDVPDSLIIFGSGYGFDALAQAVWLADCDLFYWGDIDTHGFAILDQLRARFPHAQSLLMDRQTLMTHRALWGREPAQEHRDLPRLTADEASLYHDMRSNVLCEQVRLEQERIAFSHVQAAINALML